MPPLPFNRPSIQTHQQPVRSDFYLYWMVRNGGAATPVGFPGHFYYPGLAYAGSVGLHSQTVQATVSADMDGSLWTQRTISGGTGGVPSTTLAVASSGQRIDVDCRITGTGISADTFISSYDNPGGATGNITLSQSATVTNGTSLTVWRPSGITGIVGGNGGVSGTSITITSGGDNLRLNTGISGYGIPVGTTTVSYTGGATGTLVISQAAAVQNGVELHLHTEAENARMFVCDMELGGATPTSMQNCLTWMRDATGYGTTPYPKGVGSPPLGIYWGRECALGKPQVPIYLLRPDQLAATRADNDTMTAAVTGTGAATCNFVCPEVYDNYRIDKMTFDLYWVASEWERQGITAKLVPFINPRILGTARTLRGKTWRAVLECGIHNPNISGFFIWHADRSGAWDENEEWFQETLDFISTYGLTTAPKGY